MRLKFLCFFFVIVTSLIQAQTSKISVSQLMLGGSRGKDSVAMPIKVGRTVSFDIEEGSYLDVDISPNDTMILFSCLGELFSLPAKGGTAKQITHGLGINSCPIWSPNGKLKAYISDATGFIRIHITDSAGKLHKVLGEEKLQLRPENLKLLWFPDSKHILAGNDIYDLTGLISTLPKEIKKLIGFSSEGKFMYCLQEISRDSSALFRLNRLTSQKSRLIVYNKPWDKLNIANGKISPDGNWLSYIKFEALDYYNGRSGRADSLMIINLKTGDEKLLAYLDIKFTGFLNALNYSFSKDSKYLFIGYGGKIHRIEIEASKNEIIPFTRSEELV